MIYRILVASYTNDIRTLSFDSSNASLTISSSITVGHHPSWITSYPGDNTLIFTGLEQAEGKILALKYDTEGKGSLVAEASSGGKDPCSLLATKDELLIANYSSESVGVLPISPSAPFFAATSPRIITLGGSGPNTDRQETSHPHQVIIHDGHQELLVPDLGADKVWRFTKAHDGTWQSKGHIEYEAGGGPRHVAFYNGDLFTLLELSSKIVRHRFPLSESPSFVTSTNTMLQPPPTPNDMLAAEVLIPATNLTYSTPYLYLSNRNDPSPDGDIISVFAIENSDILELVTEVRTGLKHVRAIVFGGPDDKYLIAAGAQGGGVKVFERTEGGRNLKLVSSNDSVDGATGFIWLS